MMNDHPPTVACVLDQWFDTASLPSLRGLTRACAAGAGMPADRSTDIVIALHELAANAVRHGAGSGRLRIWNQGGLHCHIDDAGPARPGAGPGDPGTGRPPGPNLADSWPYQPGHGLWVARQVASQMTLRSDSRGTRVVIAFWLPAVPSAVDAASHRNVPALPEDGQHG
jgi:anti-sigma regulatory factor (Ser/Thr protein kinase)